MEGNAAFRGLVWQAYQNRIPQPIRESAGRVRLGFVRDGLRRLRDRLRLGAGKTFRLESSLNVKYGIADLGRGGLARIQHDAQVLKHARKPLGFERFLGLGGEKLLSTGVAVAAQFNTKLPELALTAAPPWLRKPSTAIR